MLRIILSFLLLSKIAIASNWTDRETPHCSISKQFQGNKALAVQKIEALHEINYMLKPIPLKRTGGTSGNHNDLDKLYRGCDRYTTIEKYLGSKENVTQFLNYIKPITELNFSSFDQSSTVKLDFEKDLQDTILCEVDGIIEKDALFDFYTPGRSAHFLPKRFGEKDLIRLSTTHSSFSSDDVNKKFDVLLKELTFNYVVSYNSDTMNDMAKVAYVIFRRLLQNELTSEQAVKLMAENNPDFPSTEYDEMSHLKLELEILREQNLMLKEKAVKN